MHRSAARKLMDALHDLVVKIKRALNGGEVRLSDNQKAAFRDLADKVGEMERLFSEAQEMTQSKAGSKNAANEGGGVKFSIKETKDGKKYVKADRQVIFGNDPQSWSEQLEDYINGKIRRGQDVFLTAADGDILTLPATSAGKLSDTHTSDGRTISETTFERKANAASHIDELAQVSTRGKKNVRDYGNRHGNMAADGWNYRIAYFEDFDGSYYEVTISVAENADGKIIYNIGQMEKRSSPQINGSSVGNNGALRGTASSDSVPQSTSDVKPKYSLKTDSEGRLFSEALETTQSKAGSKNAANEGGGVKFSIKMLDDGRYYVKSDRQVLSGNDPKQWGKQLQNYINTEIRKGNDIVLPTTDGRMVRITERSAYKLADDKTTNLKTHEKTRLSDANYRLKEEAASHIDEIVLTGEFSHNQEDIGGYHENDIGEDGFNTYTAYFEDSDGKYYYVEFTSAINGDEETAYNIGNIRERKKPTSGRGSSARESSALNGGKLSTDNVAQSSSGVKSNERIRTKKYSLKEYSPEERKQHVSCFHKQRYTLLFFAPSFFGKRLSFSSPSPHTLLPYPRTHPFVARPYAPRTKLLPKNKPRQHQLSREKAKATVK